MSELRAPTPDQLFPRPLTTPSDWTTLFAMPAFEAIVEAVQRESYRLKSQAAGNDMLANQLKLGRAQGLDSVLNIINSEREAAKDKDD